MKAVTLRLEGGVLGPDVLEKLTELPGQKPKDFGIDGRQTLVDYASAGWTHVRRYWAAYQSRLHYAKAESLTTVTREHWVIPLLEVLGHSLAYQRSGAVVDGEIYAISHRAGDGEEAPPVHIVGSDQELGRRPPAGRGRKSPHALLQEYLNRTEHLWGIVTNGRTLRILRQAPYIARQAYIEFDLESMLDGNQFNEFILLLRLAHRTRFPRTMADAKDCLLEEYHQQAIEEGGRIRDGLRDAVERAIVTLADGFLRHPRNEELRERVRTGELSPRELYRQLLHLVYRLFFLLVAEERGLLSEDPVYLKHYGLSRLRTLAEHRPTAPQRFDDLYLSLRTLFHLLRKEELARELGLPPLNGDLFSQVEMRDLESAQLSNADLLDAVFDLSFFTPREEKVRRRVNYAALDVEELGSVYESLLEFEPMVSVKSGVPRFELGVGTERKSTGSYYTPRELVHELVESALVPVLEKRLASCTTKDEKEQAILSLTVCDPACGSGHFLLAAARRLGRELAKGRTEEEEPPPEETRTATRDVIAHCLHGVDKNPLAVELCKVALWIEGHTEGKPLTFLNHRIRCGDSLVGVADLSVLEEGIPDAAYKAVTGDDKKLASAVRKDNRRERKERQAGMVPFDFRSDLATLADQAAELAAIPDDRPEDVDRKHTLYDQHRAPDTPWWRDWMAASLWTAAFFAQLSSDNQALVPTSGTLWEYLARGRGALSSQLLGHAQTLAERLRFFHWPLEFPAVFQKGGFDVVLGNPPWDLLQANESEFFASRDPDVAGLPGAKRKAAIKRLKQEYPELYGEWQEPLRLIEKTANFLRESERFPMLSGKINLYAVFAQLGPSILKSTGKAGMVVPTGIATDDSNKQFFADLVERSALASLFDFENRQGVFPGVHRSYKFSLLTMRSSPDTAAMEFAFFATHVNHLRDQHRRFTMRPEDFRTVNPNTRTCPIFRTRQDAELTKAIYDRVPVLVNEEDDKNPWGITFRQGLFNMTSDSGLFRTRDELQQDGFRLVGNRFLKGDEIYLPLYEAKMIWQFDHRSGTYEGVTSRQNVHLPAPSPAQYVDPTYLPQPWYWVPKTEVDVRLGEWQRRWLLGFRRIARTTDERTVISSTLPVVGAGDVLPLLVVGSDVSICLAACLVASANSVVCDHVARQKIGGTHLDFHYAKQLAVLPPTEYAVTDLFFILPRMVELVYNGWEMKPFADEVWYDADESLRAAIKQQWEANAAVTGGHTWDLPEWLEAYPEIETDRNKGIPRPPFKWDEDRRAHIRAELDAYYAKLYGLTRKQLRYILDPAGLTPKELEDILDPWEEITDPLDEEAYQARAAASDFPGQTFRVLKNNELKQFGHYRTRRLVLEAWERIGEAHRA